MIFRLFWGMVMYANVVETEEKKLPEIKINYNRDVPLETVWFFTSLL